MEMIECGVCGALIDPATGETHIKTGTNAATLEDQAAQIEKLQNDVSRITDAYNALKEKEKNGNGPDGTGRNFFDRLAGR